MSTGEEEKGREKRLTCTSYCSATARQQSMAAGVVPQSSCSFKPTAPASITCSNHTNQ